MNKKTYLINEFDNISQIEKVSIKFKNKRQDFENQEFKIKTKTLSGQNSGYVGGIQSIANSKKKLS